MRRTCLALLVESILYWCTHHPFAIQACVFTFVILLLTSYIENSLHDLQVSYKLQKLLIAHRLGCYLGYFTPNL